MKYDEQIQDPNTGELVSRIKVPEERRKNLDLHIEMNGQSANSFLQISRQIINLQKRQMEEFDRATKEEQEVGKEVIKLREKMGLDSAWIYNISLHMMEKREPPPETQTIPQEQAK